MCGRGLLLWRRWLALSRAPGSGRILAMRCDEQHVGRAPVWCKTKDSTRLVWLPLAYSTMWTWLLKLTGNGGVVRVWRCQCDGHRRLGAHAGAAARHSCDPVHARATARAGVLFFEDAWVLCSMDRRSWRAFEVVRVNLVHGGAPSARRRANGGAAAHEIHARRWCARTCGSMVRTWRRGTRHCCVDITTT